MESGRTGLEDTAGARDPCGTPLRVRIRAARPATAANETNYRRVTLANGNVSVYALMKLLGHESMATSPRYVDGAGTQNRAAAAQNPLYGLIEQSREP